MRTFAALLAMAVLALAPTAVTAGDDTDQDAKGSSATGYLGIHLQRVEGGLAEALDLEEDTGVLVRQVEEGSPAAKAGLKSGDIITKVGGEEVGTPSDLRKLVRGHAAGDEVEIHYLRRGRADRVSVVLGETEDRMPRRIVKRLRDKAGREVHKVRELRIHGEHGFLGVSTQSLSGDLGEYFGVEGNGGALVSSVVEGAPAEKLGLKAGDVIVKVGEKDIEDPSDLSRTVRSFEEPTTVEVVWIRDGKKKSGQVELEVREGAPMRWLGELEHLELGDLGHHLRGLGNLEGLHRKVEIHEVDGDLDEAIEELREELDELRAELKELRQQK